MIRTHDGQPELSAGPQRRHAQGPFRGDMHQVGRKTGYFAPQSSGRNQRQNDFPVKGQSPSPPGAAYDPLPIRLCLLITRHHELNEIAALDAMIDQPLKSTRYPVDLRHIGFGNQGHT
jgi:hypothetical protein